METMQDLITKVEQQFELVGEGNSLEDISKMEVELRTYFSRFYPNIDERFSIPPDYRQFLLLSRGHWLRGDKEWGLWLFSAARVGIGTIVDCDSYADYFTPPLSAWITIGHFRERHDFVLCCDPSNSAFGTVIDAYDTHPWLNNDVYTLWKDMAAFLAWAADED